jgi:hypothetical protein
MTLDLEINEVEVKVLTSLASVTWITGLPQALVEKKVAAKWSSASNEEEGYWISNYDTEGPPSIVPSSKMKSLLFFGSLEIMETYDSAASIINH